MQDKDVTVNSDVTLVPYMESSFIVTGERLAAGLAR